MSKIIEKFKVALDGLINGINKDSSIQLQFFLAMVALGMALFLSFDAIEWSIWILCIGLVLALEYINSSLERLLDLIEPKPHPMVKNAKDLASAAVLIVALTSLLIGLILILNNLEFLHV